MNNRLTLIVELIAGIFILICIIHSIIDKFFVKNNDDDNYINYDKNKRRR